MEGNSATLVYRNGVAGRWGGVGEKEITREPRRREMALAQCSE
jgi:hypothetical protein